MPASGVTFERLMRNVGQRVAEERRARRFTQAQLAERVGVEPLTIARIEAGALNFTARTLYEVATRLGVPVASLYETPREPRIRKPGRPRKTQQPARRPQRKRRTTRQPR